MRFVRRLQATSNDNTNYVVYLDQTNGNDSNIVVNDSTKPAKTLQKAIDTAADMNKPCEVRIMSDYVISGSERIMKIKSNKVVVTCKDDVVITGLVASTVTNIEPFVIKVGSDFKQLAASCDFFDVEHYIDFSVKSVSNQHKDENSNYVQNVVMNIPSGYNVSVGTLLDVYTACVNAHGVVTAISGNEMTVELESSNYAVLRTAVGKYRFINYGDDENAFKFIKTNEIYQIIGDYTNVKTMQPSVLSLEVVFNLVFKNCNFECISNNNKIGISIINGYSIRFEGCSFEYCGKIWGSSNTDITFNNSYFHYTDNTVYSKNEIVKNCLFKSSYLAIQYSMLVQNNEFCYSLKGIATGISRKETSQALNNIQNTLVIQNNELHHIGLLLQGDYGVIYQYGQKNAVIQYNYIHDCVGRTTNGSITGIYCDEAAYGMLIRYNMLVNCTSSSYTHFGRGNVFYNNLFAYPVTEQIKYSENCYECGTSYIANIFHKGKISENYINKLETDDAMFQFNVIEEPLDIQETAYVHSNKVAEIPFNDPAHSDFEIPNHKYSIDKITMGSADVRNFNQSMIDTTFFERITNSNGTLKHSYGLPADSKWSDKRGLSVNFTPNYDKWFLEHVMSTFNVSNDYLQYLEPSKFLPEEIKTFEIEHSVPTFDDIELTTVEINTQEQFDDILSKTTGTTIYTTDLQLNLNIDVKVKSNPRFRTGRTTVINGNGHKILGWNKTYQATSTYNGYNCCEYTGFICDSNTFASPTGEVLRLARTKCYDAASRILASADIIDTNGDVVFHDGDNFPRYHKYFSEYKVGSKTYYFGADSVYHCKFLLPDELSDIQITQQDNVFINLTSDWLSVQTKVIKTENGYLYFDYVQNTIAADGSTVITSNYIGIDNDWYVGKLFTSFFLINYRMEDDHSCLIKTINNTLTLLFPSRYSEVGETYTTVFNNIPIDSNFKIYNATLTGYRILYKSTKDQQRRTNIVIDNCIIHGCTRDALVLDWGGVMYVTNCEFYDCDRSAIYSIYHNSSKLVAMHNYIHDIGNARMNSYGIIAASEHYIAYNRVVDYGYGGIRSGIWSQANPSTSHPTGVYYECFGIIEHNEVYQTQDYFDNKARHFVVMDAGAIYSGIHHICSVIRHNIIYNYTGRGHNRGIYLDGGCHHIYVYSNIIANTPNSWSINAYFAQDSPYYGIPYTLDNVHRYILNNYVENTIKLQGRTNYPVDTGQYYHGGDYPDGPGWNGQELEENFCYLGHNIINAPNPTYESLISGIKEDHMEEQYEITMPPYNGNFDTPLDIVGWLNKL